jgi:ribose transport system permease protein
MNSSHRPATSILLEYAGLLAVLAVLIVCFTFTTDHFYALATFRTMANQMPDALLIAVGMTLVLIAGGIDLSVGSTLALAGAVLGVVLTRAGLPLPVAILAALGTGAAIGAFNGFVTTRWQVPSFIVTLGTLEAARGGAYLVTDSQTQYIGRPIERLASAEILGLSAPFLIALAVMLLAHIALTSTVHGRRIFAVGANEESARLSGIPVARVRRMVFTLSGLLAGLAGVLHIARLGAADPNAAIGYELTAIAAVVIGGTSLLGGRGSVLKSALGLLIIAVLETGLTHAGAGDPTKRLVTGAVIITAVIFDVLRNRLRA